MADGGAAQVYRGSLDRVLAAVSEASGLDLGQYRRTYFERRLGTRLRALGLTTYRQYADRLAADPSELPRLLDALTINVTGFFRDPVVWESLREHALEPLFEAKRARHARTVRAWSAGCATGEEPYSLAMALYDTCGEGAAENFRISVVATDLDPGALQTAEAGRYGQDKLRSIPQPYQVRFTRAVDEAMFEVSPEVRRLVRFANVSLFAPPPLKVVDLIMCRNLFIYLDRDKQARALEMFWSTLASGGYLVLGRSEKLADEIASRFEPVDGRERIYRKPGL